VYLGEAQNVAPLCHAGGSGVNDTEYPRLVPCEKPNLLIKVDPGNPMHPTSTDIGLEMQPTTGPPSSNKSTQSKPTRGI